MAEAAPAPMPAASLPMYDWPEAALAHDVLWRAIGLRLRDAGIGAPAGLDRATPPDTLWRAPGLVLSQTCGYPFATRLRGVVQLVAVPIYSAEGCSGPHYSSALVVRAEETGRRLADFVGRRFAFNSRDSLSGYVALVDHMNAAGLSPAAAEWVETGSHRASLRAVAAGRADVAAIDAVCLALAQAHETDALARLRIIERTALRGALPFITAAARPPDEVAAIRAALVGALGAPETVEAAQALCLSGVEAMDEAEYLRTLRLPAADLSRNSGSA